MLNALINIFLALLAALRRLWQRLTGRSRRPVPVPIRARYSPFSLKLTDFRSPTGAPRPWNER